MLPVVSSSRAQDNTSSAPSKTASGCGRPAPSTRNRSRVRLGRGLPSFFKTLTYAPARRAPPRKVGSDGAAGSAPCPIAATQANTVQTVTRIIIYVPSRPEAGQRQSRYRQRYRLPVVQIGHRSEEHTSELQSHP